MNAPLVDRAHGIAARCDMQGASRLLYDGARAKELEASNQPLVDHLEARTDELTCAITRVGSRFCNGVIWPHERGNWLNPLPRAQRSVPANMTQDTQPTRNLSAQITLGGWDKSASVLSDNIIYGHAVSTNSSLASAMDSH